MERWMYGSIYRGYYIEEINLTRGRTGYVVKRERSGSLFPANTPKRYYRSEEDAIKAIDDLIG